VQVPELRRRVDALANEPALPRRRLVALAALTERLAPLGRTPILVGDMALELYTEGGYATHDVDIALSHGPEIDAAFADLGFEKRGRFWVRTDLALFFEAPAPEGLPGETAPRLELQVDDMRVVVIGVEDLLLDRLRAWVHRKSTEDERWARRLVGIHGPRIDWRYLRERVKMHSDERAALATLEPR
jgi:hypothetical protein